MARRKRRVHPKKPLFTAPKLTPEQRLVQRIRQERKRLKLTVKQLAERAGLHVNTVGLINVGKTLHPQPETLKKLASALGQTPDELLGFNEDGTVNEQERWLLAEFRRLNAQQKAELLEYLRDAGDTLSAEDGAEGEDTDA